MTLTNIVVNIATHTTIDEEAEVKVLPCNGIIQTKGKVWIRITNEGTVIVINLTITIHILKNIVTYPNTIRSDRIHISITISRTRCRHLIACSIKQELSLAVLLIEVISILIHTDNFIAIESSYRSTYLRQCQCLCTNITSNRSIFTVKGSQLIAVDREGCTCTPRPVTLVDVYGIQGKLDTLVLNRT